MRSYFIIGVRLCSQRIVGAFHLVLRKDVMFTPKDIIVNWIFKNLEFMQ